MSNIDDLVNRWFISEWTDPEGRYGMHPKYDPVEHGPIENLKVITTDGEWQCGCYSSWTRDDEMVMTAEIAARNGSVMVEYGRWADFPEFVLSVISFGELEDACSIEYRQNHEDD